METFVVVVCHDPHGEFAAIAHHTPTRIQPDQLNKDVGGLFVYLARRQHRRRPMMLLHAIGRLPNQQSRHCRRRFEHCRAATTPRLRCAQISKHTAMIP